MTVTAKDVQDAFSTWREANTRVAWKPSIDPESNSSSWFGGDPSLPIDKSWPDCAECGKPMQFMLQLDLSRLPEQFNAVPAEGLLQFFYCSTDDGMCETWAPFVGTSQLWIVPNSDQPTKRLNDIAPLPQAIISQWQAIADLPHPDEHGDLGITYDYDFPNKKLNVTCDAPRLEFKDLDLGLGIAEAISEAEFGDKLGGWPAWVQSAEYPNCPVCGTRMGLLFQVDSEDNLPIMFGDCGCGHITQCPKHPQQLAFGWACG